MTICETCRKEVELTSCFLPTKDGAIELEAELCHGCGVAVIILDGFDVEGT